MALESGTYISDLNPSNPVGATDKVSTLDDHVRLIKATLQTTFPGISGEVSATHTELNFLDGVTGTTGTGQLVLDDAPTIADLTVTDSITLPAASIADAALSDNVALLNAPNEFSAPATFSTTAPRVEFFETDAGTDEGLWRIFAADGRFGIQVRDDDSTVASTFMQVFRDGVQVTEIELNADAFDFNGNADISGTLAVGGAATFSNNVTVGGTISGNGSGLTNLNASNLSSGTVPSARLPATIGGNKTFSDNVTVGGTITGNGSGLTSLNASNLSSGTVPSARLPATIGGNKTFSDNVTIGGALRIASEGGVIYHDSTNNLGGKIVLSSSEATTAGQVGAAGDMRFVYAT